MNKFTKAPWIIDTNPRGNSILIVEDDELRYENRKLTRDTYLIAEVMSKNNEADAHLIASAPDMYEALEQIVKNWHEHGTYQEEYKKAVAALKKARGEQ